ncbi:endolytic transglycosylase MltG [Sediminibacterium ginsengisoli]|uniref:Endolytic murein transglycosylase n=1 Tax=Sediminibacterium ginsengisoli TaxID=413434 RepID=A0A1T4RA78_9BACT|nr:endolytic transglycosylase MltG [Sediminibacterium ginsengisoli]SKA12829.1 UPF0755 protein [Sediminibacterium ginsengisoli]
MKRIFTLILLLIVLAGGIVAWQVLVSGTGFSEKSRFFVISEGQTDKASVLATLKEEKIINNTTVFSLISGPLGVWDRIRPGKYEVKKGDNLLTIGRILKNNRQAQLKLVINKIRRKEDLARLISHNLGTDSASVMQFMQSNDSLSQYGVDTSTVFTAIIQNTYNFFWKSSPRKIFNRLYEAQQYFWENNNRLEKAKARGLDPKQVYILASIVDEETNYESDKYKIASVYMNRLKKSMPLQACPTIKFAMNDFTITRIYEKYLVNPSPYNTYRVKGLPPGPICTPLPKTIDIILDAPETDYLFFVAKSDFSGYHHFSSSYGEHDRFAKEYQKALDAYMARKQQQNAK